MLITSRNVNGIRAGIRKNTFFDFLQKYNPDIIGLGEVKARLDQLTKKDIAQIEELGYHICWNAAERPGYSGTAILSKIQPLNVIKGIDISELDTNGILIDEVIQDDIEGRVITLEYPQFYLTKVYTPNSKDDLSRLDYRKNWDKVFLMYMKYLESFKPVIFTGDLNVAHKDIDLARPKQNMTTDKRPGSAGFTDTERMGMTNFLNAGFIDTYRHFYPDTTEIYTWWSNFGRARDNNIGRRIDYFMISPSLLSSLKDAYIYDRVLGSDHAPVGVEIDIRNKEQDTSSKK